MSLFKFFFFLFIIISSAQCQTESSFINLIKMYIQNGVSNEVLLNLIEFIRRRNMHNFPNNYEKNRKAFQTHLNTIKNNQGFIEDQDSYNNMFYGIRKISYNGCGVIAAYNVIHFLTGRDNIDFPAIIQAFENDGIILRGLFGTSMKAVDEYLQKQGFVTKSSWKNVEYDKIGQDYDAFVLTIYNSKTDIFKGMHFIAITKKSGKFYVHNNGRNSASIAYYSISDILNRINGGNAKDIYLTGAKKGINKYSYNSKQNKVKHFINNVFRRGIRFKF